MVVRFSSRKQAPDRIEMGAIEGYVVSWRPSDQTVWISSPNIVTTNYDNMKAYSRDEVLSVAREMLWMQGLISTPASPRSKL